MSNAESLRTRFITKRALATRLLLALGGGVLAYFAYQRLSIWILCFPMVGLIYLAVRNLRFRAGFGVGLVAGFTFFAAQTAWLSMYLGPVPLIALSLLQGLIFALFIALSQLSRPKSFWLKAVLFAAFWVAREWFSGHYPYGGFPWAKLVQSQADTTLSRWVWLGGTPLADFLIAAGCVVVIEFWGSGARRNAGIALGMASVLLYAAPIAFPISTKAEVGTLKIAAAQGNANAGLFANRVSGLIMENHILATNRLLASKKPFDLLVWPENAVDVDLTNPANEAMLDSLVNRINRPLIFGTVNDSQGLYNSSELALPRQGIVQRYDKKYPVPFAEYVPDRPFWSAIAPDLIGLLNYDFLPGKRSGVFNVSGHKVGVLICFEIAIDQIQHDLVSGGATVILSQTNNSDFGHSDEAFQQLAIAKLRAIELGRSIVNISTVGPSAIYLPDGRAKTYLGAFQRGYMVADVPLRESQTPAFYLANLFESLCVVLAAMQLIWGIARRVRNKN